MLATYWIHVESEVRAIIMLFLAECHHSSSPSTYSTKSAAPASFSFATASSELVRVLTAVVLPCWPPSKGTRSVIGRSRDLGERLIVDADSRAVATPHDTGGQSV